MKLKILALGNEETTRWVENSLTSRNMEIVRFPTLPDSMASIKQENFNLALVDCKTEDIKDICFKIIWLGRIRVALMGGGISPEESDELRSLGIETFLPVNSDRIKLAAEVASLASRGSLVFHQIKVVVIEDDKYIREAIRLCFKIFWPEAEVYFADDGHRGIDNIKSRLPDIVLLDLGLPDMSGYDVLKRIRVFSQVPVIILSATRDKGNIIEAIQYGANDYIIKPFRQIELIPRIKKLSGY
jgi:CheY-like chemotaxis protein